MAKTFSDRNNYRDLGMHVEITVREDAPDRLRSALPLIAKEAGLLPTFIRRIVCEVLLIRSDPNNWSEYPNVWEEVNELIATCPWFHVYDIAEKLHASIRQGLEPAQRFRDRLNECFRTNGIGWEMQHDGQITFRGSEAFASTTKEAIAVLTDAGRTTSANEMHEALRDISRRPEPDVTGAIQHAIAALEATARDVTGKPDPTLGQLVDRLVLPDLLDTAVKKLWRYASDRARHGREGSVVGTPEAELLVSVAGALCTFLSRRRSGDP